MSSILRKSRASTVAVGIAVLLVGGGIGISTALAGGGSTPDLITTPCDSLLTRVDGAEPIADVARSVGLPANAAVPAQTAVGNVYCLDRQQVGGDGDVLGFVIASRSGDDAWLLKSRHAGEISAGDWRALMKDHGWATTHPADYGLTTRPNAHGAPTTNIWTELARDRRQNDANE